MADAPTKAWLAVRAALDDELINHFLDHLRRKADFTARALGKVAQFVFCDPLRAALGGFDADLVAVVPDRIDRVTKSDKALPAGCVLDAETESLVEFLQLVFGSVHSVEIGLYHRFVKLVYGTTYRPSR